MKKPTDCKYFRKCNFFEWLMDMFPHCDCPKKESGICIWGGDGKNLCEYYEPKEKTNEEAN